MINLTSILGLSENDIHVFKFAKINFISTFLCFILNQSSLMPYVNFDVLSLRECYIYFRITNVFAIHNLKKKFSKHKPFEREIVEILSIRLNLNKCG